MKTFLTKLSLNLLLNAIAWLCIAVYLVIHWNNLWQGVLDGVKDFMK